MYVTVVTKVKGVENYVTVVLDCYDIEVERENFINIEWINVAV